MEAILDIPILFIIYNRPDKAQAVFDAIRKVKPAKLYVSADGPKHGVSDDPEMCDASRRIISQVDWRCEVKLNYREVNRGCKHAIHDGISWFFDNEEKGIILEDDCVPVKSFFYYCRELLDYYADDERIMMISGNNFQFGRKRGEGSYYYSRYGHIWGWATWRRSWNYNDLSMPGYPEFKKRGLIDGIFNTAFSRFYWGRLFDLAYQGKIDTWDIQWQFSIVSQSGLSILPNTNLVTNIGCGEKATHTKSEDIFACLDTGEISELVHPKIMARDAAADEYYEFLLKKRELSSYYHRILKSMGIRG